MSQLSTALSDFVLALSSFYVAYRSNGQPYQSFYALSTIGLAATLGVFRFGLNRPSADLTDAHKVCSWLGSVVGIPLMAAGLLKRAGYLDVTLIFTFVPVGFLFLYKILPSNVRGFGNTVLPISSVLSMLISSVLLRDYYGMLTVGAILAAALVGTVDSIAHIPRVDVFHYLLALGNVFYMYAMEY